MMMRRYLCFLLLPPTGILAALVLAVSSVRAQQPAPPAGLPEAQEQQLSASASPFSADPKEEPKPPDLTTREQQTGTSNERLFWVLPDFSTLPRLSAVLFPPAFPHTAIIRAANVRCGIH
jgi:hypothetical protein